MPPVLRLCEDVLSDGAALSLPALPRLVFMVHGSIAAGDRVLRDGEAWSGEDAAAFKAGGEGATVWRWELGAAETGDVVAGTGTGTGIASREKLAARLDTLPQGPLLLRADSVAFPPGGGAYLHRHQGPGIRCLIEGGIRIDTDGRSTSYGPGGAWYENGPEPVFAQAAADRATRFIRVMVLPAACLGKSSLEYLNAEDKGKPKSQQYKIFADMPLRLATGR
jgi:hypothetical protein